MAGGRYLFSTTGCESKYYGPLNGSVTVTGDFTSWGSVSVV